MTVKELFNSLTFDEVIAALRNTHCNDRSIRCLAGYKEAFDIITHTHFEGEGGEVTFDVTPKGEWSEPHSLPLLANNVEGDYWHNTVGKTVVKPANNPFTDAELAGAILWGMTFYGFTQRCTRDLFATKIHRTAFTKYGKRAKALMIRRELPYAKFPGMRQYLKNQLTTEGDSISFHLSMEEWNCLDERRLHLNRSKRKRDYRIGKRIEWLKKLDRRQHTIDVVSSAVGTLPDGIEKDIINAGSICETWRESHTYGSRDRIVYIKELLAMSPTLTDICDGDDKTIICCYTSSDTLLSETERQRLRQLLFEHQDNRIILFGTDVGVARRELALQFIGIRRIITEDSD